MRVKVLFLSIIFVLQCKALVSDREFFGENRLFVDIMNGESSKEIIKLKKNKKRAIEIYKKHLSNSGLALKLSAADRLDSDFKGYSADIEWNLFKDGVFGYSKKSKRQSLEYELYYDNILNNAQQNYLLVSLFEIDDIKRYIDKVYNHKKLYYLRQAYIKSKKKLKDGLVTKQNFNKIANLYRKAKDRTKNKIISKKLFDKSFKNFILNIEDAKLWNEREIIEKAKKFNEILNSQRLKIKKEDYISTWADDVEANIYLSKRRYTFIDREDSIVGAKVKIPLELKESSDLVKLNRHILSLKLKSEEALLEKKIHHFYVNFLTHTKEIRDLLSKLEKFTPLDDLQKAQKIEIEQNIWSFRVAALKDLLQLQFLTGIKLF